MNGNFPKSMIGGHNARMSDELASAAFPKVRLNIDLGELSEEDASLYAAAHIANIACGGHAGDESSMRLAAERCRQFGTAVSAHPSYPDRSGFGRRVLPMAAADLQASIGEQLLALRTICEAYALPLGYLKPHGALYHEANKEPEVAAALLDAAQVVLTREIVVIGPGSGALRDAAARRGLGFAVEGFADRGRIRDAQGRWQLVPRGQPGDVLHEVERVQSTVDALLTEGQIHTLCLHGDNPAAVALAPRVRQWLEQHGEHCRE